jgi:multidrug resistance efflux pump
MTSKTFSGQVIVDIIEVRFAFSGQITQVVKRVGDRVTAGGLLAALDRKLLQTELDRELADYERVRAEFEIFVAKLGTPQNDIDKYAKTQMQSRLNSSVKAVELAKLRLDQADLFSPVTGTVIADGGNRPGLHITPASNSFRISDSASLRFQFEINPAALPLFAPDQPVSVTIRDQTYSGKLKTPVFDGKKFTLDIIFTDPADLVAGLPGQLAI